MKLGIVSDTHLGYRKFEDNALDQGRKAFLMAAELSDVIIAPGDLFDTRVPKLETLLQMIELLREIQEKHGKKIYVVPGTHERRSKELTNPIDLLASAGLVINVHNRTIIHEHNGERIAIAGMNGMPEEYAAEAVKQLSVKPIEGAFNLFIFHQSIRELMPVKLDTFMGKDDLPDGFDLYVDGHLHKKRINLGEEKPLIIPGSTVITQLREEEQEEKGIVIFDTLKRTAEFVPIGSRKFIVENLEFQDSRFAEVHGQILKIAERPENRGAIVKVILEGTLKEGEVFGRVEGLPEGVHVEIDNRLQRADLGKKLAEIKELRNQNGESIMNAALRASVQGTELEKEFEWKKAFEVFSNEEGIELFVKELVGE